MCHERRVAATICRRRVAWIVRAFAILAAAVLLAVSIGVGDVAGVGQPLSPPDGTLIVQASMCTDP